MFCEYCGTELTNDAKFCTSCGASTGIYQTSSSTVNGTGDQAKKYRRIAGICFIVAGIFAIFNNSALACLGFLFIVIAIFARISKLMAVGAVINIIGAIYHIFTQNMFLLGLSFIENEMNDSEFSIVDVASTIFITIGGIFEISLWVILILFSLNIVKTKKILSAACVLVVLRLVAAILAGLLPFSIVSMTLMFLNIPYCVMLFVAILMLRRMIVNNNIYGLLW